MNSQTTQSVAVVDQAALEAKARREAWTTRQMIRAEEVVKTLDGVSLGYIGNVYSDGTDDRSWFIFLPHPGRIGEAEDRIGGFDTSDRAKLLPLLNAIKVGFDLAKNGAESRAVRAQYRTVDLPKF